MRKVFLACALAVLAAAEAPTTAHAQARHIKIVFQGAILFYSEDWQKDFQPVWALLPQDTGHAALLHIPHRYVEKGLNLPNNQYRLPDYDDGVIAVYRLQGEELLFCDPSDTTQCVGPGGGLSKNWKDPNLIERAPCHVNSSDSCDPSMPNQFKQKFLDRKKAVDWIAEVPDFRLKGVCPDITTCPLTASLKFSAGDFSTERLEGQKHPDDTTTRLKFYQLPKYPGTKSKAIANGVSVNLTVNGDWEIRSSSNKPILLSAPSQDNKIVLAIEHLPNGEQTDHTCPKVPKEAAHFRVLYRLLDLHGMELCDLLVPVLDSIGGMGGDEACPPGRK